MTAKQLPGEPGGQIMIATDGIRFEIIHPPAEGNLVYWDMSEWATLFWFLKDDPRGRPELRRALAEYLGRARGVLTSPDRVVASARLKTAMLLKWSPISEMTWLVQVFRKLALDLRSWKNVKTVRRELGSWTLASRELTRSLQSESARVPRIGRA